MALSLILTLFSCFMLFLSTIPWSSNWLVLLGFFTVPIRYSCFIDEYNLVVTALTAELKSPVQVTVRVIRLTPIQVSCSVQVYTYLLIALLQAYYTRHWTVWQHLMDFTWPVRLKVVAGMQRTVDTLRRQMCTNSMLFAMRYHMLYQTR